MFEIHFDNDTRVMHITLRGYWNDEIMNEFEVALRKELAETRKTAGGCDCLTDTTDFAVQSHTIIERHRLLFAQPDIKFGRAALVISSALIRMQSNRVANDGEIRIFENKAAALAWLIP